MTTQQPKPFPDVPDTLAKELDRLFPERCPDLKDPARQVWFKAGQRAVVSFLLQKNRIQREGK